MKTTDHRASAWRWLLLLPLLTGVFAVKYWHQENTSTLSAQDIIGPAVLLVRGDDSPSCQAIHHLVDEAAKKYGDRIHVVRIDWSADNSLIEKYRVRFLPSVVFIDAEGRKVGEVVGESPAVQRKLQAALAAFDRP